MKENPTTDLGFEDEELKQYNLLYEQKQKELMDITSNKVKNLEFIQSSNEQKILELRELNKKFQEENRIYLEKLEGYDQREKEYFVKIQEFKLVLDNKNKDLEKRNQMYFNEISEYKQELALLKKTENSLKEKNALLIDELKHIKWKSDEQLRDLTKELEDTSILNRKLNQEKDNAINVMMQDSENRIRKVIDDHELEILKIKEDYLLKGKQTESELSQLKIAFQSTNKENENLRYDFENLKKIMEEEKIREELNSKSMTRKISELQVKFAQEEQEKIIAISSRESISKDLLKKIDQLTYENQVIQNAIKSSKDKYAFDICTKEESLKLEIEKANVLWKTKNEQLEVELNSKKSFIDQITREISMKNEKILALESQLLMLQSNKLNIEKLALEQNEKNYKEIKQMLMKKEIEVENQKEQISLIENSLKLKNEEISKLENDNTHLIRENSNLKNETICQSEKFSQEVYLIKSKLNQHYRQKIDEVSQKYQRLQREYKNVLAINEQLEKDIKTFNLYPQNFKIEPKFDQGKSGRFMDLDNLERIDSTKKIPPLSTSFESLYIENQTLNKRVTLLLKEIEKLKGLKLNQNNINEENEFERTNQEKNENIRNLKAELTEKTKLIEELTMNLKNQLESTKALSNTNIKIKEMQKTISNLKNERQALIEISTQLRAQLNSIQGQPVNSNSNFNEDKGQNAAILDFKKIQEEEEISLHKLTLNKLKKQYQEDF